MFKKFSTFRHKLKYSQAKRLALCLSLLIGLSLWGTFFFPHIPDNVSQLLLYSLVGIFWVISATLISYATIFAPLFHVLYKQLDEENEKAKKKLTEEFNLTKENYTKVNYSYEEILKDVPNKDCCLTLLTNANYSFYVKLTYDSHHEKDALELIVKDVNENIVYQDLSISFRIYQKYIKKI